jgi:hypothetical protein
MAEVWGTPDWMDAAGYPVPTEMTHRAWRWEFLRRRPDYREAWRRCSAAGVRETAGVRYALPDDYHAAELSFGLTRIYDPRSPMAEKDLFRAGVFLEVAGAVREVYLENVLREGVWMGERKAHTGDGRMVERRIEQIRRQREREEQAGRVSLIFDVSRPLAPQRSRGIFA